MNVRFIRRFQTVFSIISFIGVFLLCWWKTGFDLTKIQLSYFGVNKDIRISEMWNITTELISASIFVNAYFYLKNNSRIIHKNKFYFSFFIISLLLFLTGFINMHYRIHTWCAVVYFFLYPLLIFTFSFVNRKILPYNEWRGNFRF